MPTTHTLLLTAAITLAAALLIILLARLAHRRTGVRFGWTCHLFALAAGLLAALHLAPWQTPLAQTLTHHLTAATIILAAFQLAAIVRRLIAPDKKNGAGAMRVLGEIASVLIITASILLALQLVYDQPVPGLLAGSGVLAIVLGLAMQELLVNIIAGIAIHAQKTFKTGDWLIVDNTHARVVEMTWRSTRLVTFDDVILEVPNSIILRNTITNFEKPASRHVVGVSISLHYTVPPHRAQTVLREAALSVAGVISTAPIYINLREFADSAITYDIRFYVRDHGTAGLVQSDVRVACWYATQRAGMDIPYKQIVLNQPTPPYWHTTTARDSAARMLRAHPILNVLDPAQIATLVQASPVLLFCPNTPIVRQGAPGQSMFLICKGTAEVRIPVPTDPAPDPAKPRPDATPPSPPTTAAAQAAWSAVATAVAAAETTTTAVATLNPGDCFGEMSLLTGEPRTATVTSTTELEAVEITKDTFAAILKQNPGILARLGEMLVQRQQANEQTRTRAPFAKTEQTPAKDPVLRRLRAFFNLDD